MTTELQEIYLNANIDTILIDTLALSHPSWSKTYYLCKNSVEFIGKLEDNSEVTYIPWGFDYKLPDATKKGQSNSQFVIDATDKEILKEYFEYKKDPTVPITLDYRQYFNTSKEIQTSFLDQKLMDITFNYNKIQGAGSRPDINNRLTPYKRYDKNIYKGLKYV